MEAKKSNKIREIVKLQQILKKWRKMANASKTSSGESNGNGNKSIKYMQRTMSMTDAASVPKGYLAVSVGEEQKRYTIPTEYLSHQTFHELLREAEEEFGFQQAGVLRIPCEVQVFESILKIMEEKKDTYLMMMTHECRLINSSSDCPRTPSHHPHSPMCR